LWPRLTSLRFAAFSKAAKNSAIADCVNTPDQTGDAAPVNGLIRLMRNHNLSEGRGNGPRRIGSLGALGDFACGIYLQILQN